MEMQVLSYRLIVLLLILLIAFDLCKRKQLIIQFLRF